MNLAQNNLALNRKKHIYMDNEFVNTIIIFTLTTLRRSSFRIDATFIVSLSNSSPLYYLYLVINGLLTSLTISVPLTNTNS